MIKFDSNHCRSVVANQLMAHLLEPAPARAQLLTGPRQVGKTTLLLDLARKLPNSRYFAVDSPEASIPGWWEMVWREIRLSGAQGQRVVFFDEIQHLEGWERLLKAALDQLHREHLPVHVVLTGSSALLVGRGVKETMAGRFEKLSLLHWTATDLLETFSIGSEQAVRHLVQKGSYPGAFPLQNDLLRWKTYMRESIIEPAISRDILMLEPIRKPALLRQLFMVCLGHPSEIISLQKMAGNLRDKGALETLSHYLQVLEQACLLTGLEKFSLRALRRRAAPPKLVILNNGLLAAFQNRVEPEEKSPEWGSWVENACLAHAWNSGQKVFYWREEPYEVDGIFMGSWGEWAVEIKTGNFSMRDLAGLFEFCRRHPHIQPLLLCSKDRASEPIPGIKVMRWSDFLLGEMPH